MIEELGEDLTELLIKVNKVKIKKENTLKDYLNQYNKNQLIALLASNVLYKNFNECDDVILNIISLKNKRKSEIIEYIYNNREILIKEQLKYINSDFFEILKKCYYRNGYIKSYIEDSDFEFDLGTIYEMKKNIVMFFDYDEKNEEICYHIPSDIIGIIKKYIFSKKLNSYREIFNKIKTLLSNAIEVYGVIKIKEIVNLYYKEYNKCNIEEFKEMLLIASTVLSDIVKVFRTSNSNDEIMIYSMDFPDEQDAIKLYNTRDGNYKKFGKNEFKKIDERSFYDDNKNYIELCSILSNDFNEDDMYEFDIFAIDEYIIKSQLDIKEARKNLSNILSKEFGIVDFGQKEKIMKLIDSIRLAYPSWKLKGRIPNQEK